MKFVSLLSVVLLLQGCASGCQTACMFGVFGPGNSTFDRIAHNANKNDPCQHYGKPEGYQLADFCFTSRNKNVYYVYDKKGSIVYSVK